MTGVLAQLISLTAYGNQWLKTGQLPDGFYPGCCDYTIVLPSKGLRPLSISWPG